MKKKIVILVMGLPGSGKTTLAGELKKKIKCSLDKCRCYKKKIQ